MQALVTGFEPFDGDSLNPAHEALRLLPPHLGALRIATRAVPTAFGRASRVLEEAIAGTAPDIVLGVGLAGGRAALSLERAALNLVDARIPDNDGAQPVDAPVVPGGPPAYFATLPIKAAVAALREAGLPAEVSNTAGTFVCNALFYRLMHCAATRRPGLRGGFLHVPYLPALAADHDGAPSMALTDIVRGIEIVLAVAARQPIDNAAASAAMG